MLYFGQMNAKQTDIKPSPEALRQARSIVVGTMTSTTLRVVVPAVIGVALGMYGDVARHTKPWLTLGGLALGFVVAAVLIYRQIKELNHAA